MPPTTKPAQMIQYGSSMGRNVGKTYARGSRRATPSASDASPGMEGQSLPAQSTISKRPEISRTCFGMKTT